MKYKQKKAKLPQHKHLVADGVQQSAISQEKSKNKNTNQKKFHYVLNTTRPINLFV